MEVIKAKTDMSEDQQFDFYENMFNALADKIRLKILNIKQSKLSYHLKKLVDANVLIAEKHGTWNYYKINEQQIQVVLNEDTCCKIL